jgi:polyhydroxyalkanoate synthesis regulator protein
MLCASLKGEGRRKHPQETTMIQQASILIKRYGGERLYDTVAGRYVTVADIRSMADAGHSVVVLEAADGTDITDRLIVPETRRH